MKKFAIYAGLLVLLGGCSSQRVNFKAAVPTAVIDAKVCELSMKMETFDGYVYSSPICIKYATEGISIPERIALNVQDGKTVRRDYFCEKEDTKTAHEGLCLWNKKYSDRYPMKFYFYTNTHTPISGYLSLLRVVRNGRIIYRWDVNQAQTGSSQITIAPEIFTKAEYFKEPVELSFFLLPSGADVAKIAAIKDFESTARSWQKSLSDGLGKIVSLDSTLLPDSARLATKCYEHKIKYLHAINSDSKTDEIEQKIRDLNRQIQDQNDLIKKAQAPHTPQLRLATEQSYDLAKAPVTLEGEKLAHGELVLFLDKDGSKGRVLVFDRPSAAWGSLTNGELNAFPSISQDRALKVNNGKKGGVVFKFKNWTNGTESLEIEALSEALACSAPDETLKEFKAKINTAIEEAAASKGSGTLEELSRKTAYWSGVLREQIDKNQQYIRQAIDQLPPSSQEQIRKNLTWLRTIEETSAQLMNAAEQWRELGPVLQKQVVSNLRDPAVQLRAYNAFASTLQTDKSIFSQTRSNPDAGDGEKTFSMQFVRPKQTYRFLAWNAVPIPVRPYANVKVEPRVDYLIPIIDVFGAFYQTERGFFPTFGYGIGFMGAREEIYKNKAEGTTYTTAFNVGFG